MCVIVFGTGATEVDGMVTIGGLEDVAVFILLVDFCVVNDNFLWWTGFSVDELRLGMGNFLANPGRGEDGGEETISLSW